MFFYNLVKINTLPFLLMKKIFYLSIVALAMLSCQSDDSTPLIVAEEPEEVIVETPENITFTEVTAGNFPYAMFPFPAGNFVINSQADWTTFLTHPVLNVPVSINLTLDHALYTYLAVRHDHHAHTNSSVKIYVESVVEFNDAIKVSYVKTTYAEGEAALLIESHPYQLVRIPKTVLPITFVQL